MTENRDIPLALVQVLRDAHHVCVLTGAGVAEIDLNPTMHAAT